MVGSKSSDRSRRNPSRKPTGLLVTKILQTELQACIVFATYESDDLLRLNARTEL